MSDLIKSLIDIKNRHAAFLSFPAKSRLSRFEEVFGTKVFNIKEREKDLVDKIIQEVKNDKIGSEDIFNIPDKYPEKTQIINKVGKYLTEKEALKLLQVEITKEDKFRILCESAFQDGVLTTAEIEKLEWDAELLGMTKDRSDRVLEDVREKLELAKPADFVLEIVGQEKEISIENIFSKITTSPYSLNLTKQDLKQTIVSSSDKLYFNEETKKYSLVKDKILKSGLNQRKEIVFGPTKYYYSIVELSLNNPYVSFNNFPQKQECQIIINSKNKYFNNIKPTKRLLRDVVYDGIASHLISTITATSIDPSRAFIDFKIKIGKALNDLEI